MSGKSTVARVLGERHRRSVIATDDLGAAVRAVTRPGSPPMGREDYREYYVARSVDELWREALESHRALGPAVEAVARMHATWAAPALLEGWAILPERLDDGIQRLWLMADRELLEARVRADVAFWSGASDEEAMRTKFVERSLRLNDHLRQEAPASGLVQVGATDAPEAIADRIEARLRR
jgi:hypothetical protein